MKYLLVIWALNGSGTEVVLVSKEQCFSVVQIFNTADGAPAAACFPPNAKYETDGISGGGPEEPRATFTKLRNWSYASGKQLSPLR